MKRLIGIAALAGLLGTAPVAFAGVDIVVAVPPPVAAYVAPPRVMAYRSMHPQWRPHGEYFARHEWRERLRHHHHRY